jgi:hypothetical protein
VGGRDRQPTVRLGRLSLWLGLALVSAASAEVLESAVTIALTPSPRKPAAFARTRPGLLTIALRDVSTGRDTQFQCLTTADQIPPEDISIDARTVAEVAAALCEGD